MCLAQIPWAGSKWIRFTRSGPSEWRSSAPITAAERGISMRCAPSVENGIDLDLPIGRAADGGDRMMQILAVIMARAGSAGLKDKHLLPLHGRSVIEYTFDHARAAKSISR